MKRHDSRLFRHFLLSAAAFAVTLLVFRAVIGQSAVAFGALFAAAFGAAVFSALARAARISDLSAANSDLAARLAARETIETRQSEIEAALRKSENIFRTLATLSPVGIFQTDTAGDCLFVNDRWIEMTGISREDAMGKGWSKTLHADDRDAVFNKWYQSAAEKREFAMEYRFAPRAGETVWVSGRATAFEDACGAPLGYIGTITDITESKLAEEQNRRLINELQNMKFALDESSIVAITDKNGEIGYVNNKFCEISGYEREELVGRTHYLFANGHYPKDFFDNLRQTIARGEVWKGEFKNRRKDGTFYWLETTIVPFLDTDGSVFQFISVSKDTTARNFAADRLRESENRFRTFMDSSPTVAYMKDEKGHYHFINQMMTDLYHVTTESLRGKTDFDWLPEEIAAELKVNDAKVLKSGETIKTIEIVPLADGDPHYWLTLKFPFTNNEGRRFVGGVAVDVTDRQLAEEKLAVSLAEKEMLLKEVHHRVKNNLQIISSLLSMQIRRLTDRESIEKIEETRRRVQAMALIHEKLYQSESFARLDLALYLKELSEMVFKTYQKKLLNIALKVECAPVGVSVEKALPCALIVNELISNSLKYGFPQRRRGGGNIWLRLNQNEGRVYLEVGDDGDGLPPDFDLEKTRSLGLKLVNSLVQQLDAEMEIVEKGGTIFKLNFDA